MLTVPHYVAFLAPNRLMIGASRMNFFYMKLQDGSAVIAQSMKLACDFLAVLL